MLRPEISKIKITGGEYGKSAERKDSRCRTPKTVADVSGRGETRRGDLKRVRTGKEREGEGRQGGKGKEGRKAGI